MNPAAPASVRNPVEKSFSFSLEELLPLLPEEARKGLLAMDGAERDFLLSAQQGEREAWAELPPPVRTRFAGMSDSQRQAALENGPGAAFERVQARRTGMPVLNPELELAPQQGREAPARARAVAPGGGQHPATQLAREVTGLLGLDPTWGERLRVLGANLLGAGHSPQSARRELLAVLLEDPGAVSPLLRELQRRLPAEATRGLFHRLPELVLDASVGHRDFAALAGALAARLGGNRVRSAPRPEAPSPLTRLALMGSLRG